MNTKTISETARSTLAGTISFPEVVAALIAAEVEYYQVDYVALCKRFYSGKGDIAVTPITYENLPPVADAWNLDGLRAAIYDSQHNNQKYRDFTIRAMQSGVQGYFAFLKGQRVTYLGRLGDQHIEWFPGAGPNRP